MDLPILPDPEEFFEDGLETLAPSTEPGCVCPACQVTSPRLWRIVECGHTVHKECLLPWFTRLPAHDSCPKCNVTLVQRIPLAMKIVAERNSVEVEPEILSEPIDEFGRSHHTEEAIHKTEREIMVAIIDSCLSWEIKAARENHQPDYQGVLLRILFKMDEVALPYSKYLICDLAHETAQWRAGIAKYIVDRLKKLHLASINTPQFSALRDQWIELHEIAEEEVDSHHAQLRQG